MKQKLRKFFSLNEVRLAAIFLAIVILFSLINPECFTVANLYALVRASSTNAIYALAIMISMIPCGLLLCYPLIHCLPSGRQRRSSLEPESFAP